MSQQSSSFKPLIAESIGTFLLVFIGNGAGVAAALTNTHPETGVILAAVSHGIALFLIVSIFGRISGAHVNPAVTIGLAAINRFPWSKVSAYILAQFIGAFVATLAIVALYGNKAISVASATAPALGTGINGIQGTLAEALGAFILISGVVASAADIRQQFPNGWAGIVIGGALAGAILITGPVSGAGLNPALALSPFLTSALFGGHAQNSEMLVYLIGPIIGGVVAALLYQYVSDMRSPANKVK